MLDNLFKEMAKAKLSVEDIRNCINLDSCIMWQKLNGTQEFTAVEMVLIKRTYFPHLTLDYLFEDTTQE